jgi:predicted nucleic acid-binding protein
MRQTLETSEETLNAFELDRAELVVTQQLLKIVLINIIQNSPEPRQTRQTIVSMVDDFCQGFAITGFEPDNTNAAREYMRHHAATIMSEVGNPHR